MHVSIFDKIVSVIPQCVCFVISVCVSMCSMCMCVGSAATFHSLQGPIRTCRTLCCVCGLVTLCGCVCICIYGCFCACVCTSTLAPSIFPLSWRRVRVVRWKVTDTHTRTNHTLTVYLINWTRSYRNLQCAKVNMSAYTLSCSSVYLQDRGCVYAYVCICTSCSTSAC